MWSSVNGYNNTFMVLTDLWTCSLNCVRRLTGCQNNKKDAVAHEGCMQLQSSVVQFNSDELVNHYLKFKLSQWMRK